jgi:hypothetical protein
MSASATSTRTSAPSLLYVQGAEQRTIDLEHTPFTIGRKTDKDLVIPDSRVSRDHAQIISEDGEYFVIDQGSRHGTYVNGIKRERHKLQKNDRIDFGARDAAYVVFAPDHPQSSAAAEFLSQISMMPSSVGSSDLEKLRLFLEAARKLNTTGVLSDVLVTLLDSTLRLTKAERGYVFLRDETGKLQLAAGRNARGDPGGRGDESVGVSRQRHQFVHRSCEPQQHHRVRSSDRNCHSTAQDGDTDPVADRRHRG